MDNKKRRLLIIIGLILLVVLLIVLLFFLYKMRVGQIDNYNKITSAEVGNSTYKKMKDAESENVLKQLSGMSEQKRMHFYTSEFIKAVEAKNYKKAYSYLNGDFKKNYFNTYEAFETYVKKYFPKEMSLSYENMERLGNIYVLVVNVKDILSKDPNDFEFYIVIKENAYNDFELSFSVDKPMKKYQTNIEEE